MVGETLGGHLTKRHLLKVGNVDSHLKTSIIILPSVKRHRQINNEYSSVRKAYPLHPRARAQPSPHWSFPSLLTLTPVALCSFLSQPSATTFQPTGLQVHKNWTFYLTITQGKVLVLTLMFCDPSELFLKTFCHL